MGEVLPKNWVETTLKITTSIIRGVTYKKEDSLFAPKKDSVYILRGGNIQDGDIVINNDDNVYVSSSIIKEEQFVRDNDVVIVGSTGSKKVIGKAGTICGDNNNMSFGAFLMLLRTNSINKRYHSYFFQTHYYRKIISSVAGGININNIKKEHIEDILIPLPPLTEQERIANKLDTLFAQIDNVRRATDRIPQLLKNLRQQILTHAVTGKLTNSNSIDAVLKDYLTDVRYGTSKKANYETDGVPVFRIPNISNGKIDDIDLKYVNLESSEFNKLYLKGGDILVIRSNGSVSLLGQCAVVTPKHNNYVYAGYLIRLRCNEKMNADYLSILLRSSYIRGQIIDSSHSTSGVNNINAEQLKSLRILYYSIKEQEAIVEKATALFEQLDNIEERYERLTQKLKDLPQSLLHKAFKGELVPQLPTDGSAADLLREIEVLHTTATKRKK